MGKTILTPKQLKFLELAQKRPFIAKNFYLTGGTALSEFYFKHRLSEDIDLFSEKEVNPSAVRVFLRDISKELQIEEIIPTNYLGLFTYLIRFKTGEFLKVDFNYYPFPKIEQGTNFGSLEVSSIYDIAVNKLQTIAQRFRARDYVDLYFIFNKGKYVPSEYLQRMRLDSKAKFDWPLEPKTLAAAFLRVKDIKKQDMPKMLAPFNKEEMYDFFAEAAKSLQSEIFK